MPTGPIGTCFGIAKPGVVLTANHVVKDIPHDQLFVVSTFYSPLLICKVNKVINHPKADVSALMIKPEKPLEYFTLGKPPNGYNDFPLAEDVLSYGFPIMFEKKIPPRMMKGHIQRAYLYKDQEHCYSAYELGFPAFPGQSGSPVFPDLHNRGTVIGIVTRSISFSSEQGNKGNRRSDASLGNRGIVNFHFGLDRITLICLSGKVDLGPLLFHCTDQNEVL